MDILQLYERRRTVARGRLLVSTRKISKNSLIFVERPILSLQSTGNLLSGTLVCRCCRCFIGGPDVCLDMGLGKISRFDVSSGKYPINKKDERLSIFPCRKYCGEIFCSLRCEENQWLYHGHDLLCTGLIPDTQKVEAALLQFKIHAVTSNEIFLMVADLLATVISCRRQQLVKDRGSGSSYILELLAPYLDYTRRPWWIVTTAPSMSKSLSIPEIRNSYVLDQTLRRLCHESSKLFHQALLEHTRKKKLEPYDEYYTDMFRSTLKSTIKECQKYSLFTGLFFGKIIGCFEQNAIGISVRHPLCRDILEKNEWRRKRHVDIKNLFKEMNHYKYQNYCLKGDNKKLQNINCSVDKVETSPSQLYIDEQRYCQNIASGKKNNSSLLRKDNKEQRDMFSSCSYVTTNNLDDLDEMFTPFDGIAMYSTACRMNHSCNPNVLIRYGHTNLVGSTSSLISNRPWGSQFPLNISCIALRDISINEELRISYIDSTLSLQERQDALESYGFTCCCEKCVEQQKRGNLPIEGEVLFTDTQKL